MDCNSAAPGDTGMITMSVENSSGGIIGVNLGVSTANGTEDVADMRKRLFFYIDDMAYRGGEHTPRVYLNTQEYYSYTVLPEHDLHLGDNGNASPLVWEWVFDVVGYYFYGTVTESSEADIDEYLRPVEYKLDDATFYNGILTTVDGTTSPAEFIKTLSEEDGYEGTVTTTVTASDGRIYYPVTVDDSGKGVWIYLCNLGEIERETVLDTQLGASDEDKRQFEIYLHVTAQQRQLEVTQVATEQQLKDALSNPAYDMVQLTADVALTGMLQVRTIGERILDLNGHTISSTQSYAIMAYKDVALTIMDGNIKGGGSSTNYCVSAFGSDIALSNVTVTDCVYGVGTIDTSAAGADSRVTMKKCTVRTTKACVYAFGNGPMSPEDTCLVIEDCLLESTGDFVLVGNGSDASAGTDIRIFNSTLRGLSSCIYHPQHSSSLYLEGCTLEAVTPLVVKSGTVEVMDTTITALVGDQYKAMIDPPTLTNSGFACTGAGVYVETAYSKPCSVTIGGNTVITTEYCDAVTKWQMDNPLFTITVTGGKYSHDVTAFLADGYVCNKDGDYWVVTKE